LKLAISTQAKKIAWHPTQDLLAFGGDKVNLPDDRGRGYGEQSNRTEVPVTFVSFKTS
jgi:hypothetical protein